MRDIPPKVSVCVVTYNQVAYIRQCLQSIVDQETDFEFEVIVADDCSTDGTQDIVREFAERYPRLVRPMLNESNLGPWMNYLRAHRVARGEYIAHMDGDDYALPGKLQTQSAHLDLHPECNFVWHRMHILNDSTGVLAEDRTRVEQLPEHGFTRVDLLRYMTIGISSSRMYRSRTRDFDAPPFPMLDFLINVEQIGNGTAAFAGTAPLGVYRAGIGIASRGTYVRELQKKTLLYLLSKYPQHDVEISTAAVGRLAVAAKELNWRAVVLFMGLLVRVFRPGSVADIFRHWKYLMMFRLP